MKIRPAKISDAEGIAIVGVKVWQSNYRGIFPDEELDQMSIREHTVKWKNALIRNRTRDDLKIVVAEDSDHGIVGYAGGGKYETTPPQYDCEIGAIYVLKEHQRKGIGTKLVERKVLFFQTKGWKSMIIWVLKDNYQRGFYEKLGGKGKETNYYEKWGKKYEIVGYVWEDIKEIVF